MASPFVVHDPEFLGALGDAPRLDRVVDIDAHEGPVYVADADALYFTSLPTPDWQVAIRRIALDVDRFPLAVDRVETVVKHTRVANGMTLDAGGQLLVCEQGSMAEGADQAASGRPSALHLARAVPLQGGVPLLVGGHVIGAVGVSGASSAAEDQGLAVLGSEALSLPNVATYIPKQKVHEQFRTGGLLLQTPSYKLDAGYRTGPGAVERHDHETDIMHIVHGSATVVTGEDKYLLNEGDVLVIPNGMPHQFVDVTAPFFYLVTKVQS